MILGSINKETDLKENNRKSNDSDIGIELEIPKYYISIPWSAQFYYSIRGSENFHIYLWVAKDLCWSQDYFYGSGIFGGLALLWVGVLFYHAYQYWFIEEMYMLVAVFLWLFGNFWWMIGEVYNGDDDIHEPQAGGILLGAIVWILIYHSILRPFNIIKSDPRIAKKYQTAGLKSSFTYFRTWREYEWSHTFLWLCKDVSWAEDWPITWIIFVVPTVLVALDFIYQTWKTKRMMIDCAHYTAQLLWVFGNAAWAYGELFVLMYDDDVVYDFWIFTLHSQRQPRWIASWLLLLAFVPIVMLYFIWLPLTCTGQLNATLDTSNLTQIITRTKTLDTENCSIDNSITSPINNTV